MYEKYDPEKNYEPEDDYPTPSCKFAYLPHTISVRMIADFIKDDIGFLAKAGIATGWGAIFVEKDIP